MSVVVTGGAGFIGSEVVRQLALEHGRRVVVVDTLVNGSRGNLEGLPAERVSLVEVDIRDTASLAGHMRDASVVYHLACLGVRHSLHAPRENHEVNATGTLGLLELCRRMGVPRFVYVSSSEVYGTARWAPMNEDHPTNPCTVYGASKLAGECYARAYHLTHGYPTVMVRPFNTFGPRSHHEGDSGEVIPKFLLRCLAGKAMVIFGDGTQTRDFTYVSDTARGIIQAGLVEAAIGQTINLGSGGEIAIGDLARIVAGVVGRTDVPVEYHASRPGDVLRLCADATRARTLLAFETNVSVADGLTRLLTWYQQQGVSPERLLERERVHNWTAGAE